MKPPSGEAEYMNFMRDIIRSLFYEKRLTLKNLEHAIVTDVRMSKLQTRKALNRLSFAQNWISDDRTYEWSDVLRSGSLNIFDLRMQAMQSSEALKLCLIITDLVRRAKNGVNKMIVFDEAHEYVDSNQLVADLENALTQIRHDGLIFVVASQFPERIPERIFKFLLTRFIFKLPSHKAIKAVQEAAPHLTSLSAQHVANLDLETGLCYVQTDDDCTDPLLNIPQLLEIRPRYTQHGGATIRQAASVDALSGGPNSPPTASAQADPPEELEFEAELCPECGEELVLRRGKTGRIMVCKAYPGCRYSCPASLG